MPKLARLDNHRRAIARFFSPLFIQLVAVADWISLFEVCNYFSMIGQSFDAVAAYPVVDQPAMFIPPKIVSKNGPSIKRTHPLARHIKTIFMARIRKNLSWK